MLYAAKVLAEEWPMVESALGEYGMSCKLDWVSQSMHLIDFQ